MAEAVDFLCPGTTLVRGDLQVVEVCATTTGEEEAGGMTGELEMLQIVIVSCKISVHVVTL